MRSLILAAALVTPLAAQVRFEDILKSPNANWLTYAGDYADTVEFTISYK